MTWRQFWCAFWRRHDYHRAFNKKRAWLRCVNCGAETHGWATDQRRARGLKRQRTVRGANVTEIKRKRA